MSKARKSKQQRLPVSKGPPDFVKKKDRAGKKKPRSGNETRTSFKAKAISVPRQRALEAAVVAAVETPLETEQLSEAPARRKLPLAELLPRLAHSSEQTRLEALAGLRELTAAHPDTLRMSAGLLLERLAQMVPDDDRTVRAHLRVTLCKVLGALGLAAAAPFMPLLVAYVCSGMTHPLEPIRADSVELASALLVQYPPLSRRFARRILANFGAIIASPKTMQQAYQRKHPAAVGSEMERHLRQHAQAASLPVSSFKTRAAALGSLLRFLRDLSSADGDFESHLSNKAATGDTARTFVWSEAYPVVVGPMRSLPLPEPIAPTTSMSTNASGEGKLSQADAAELLESLHPGLCELWLEATPVALDNGEVLRNVLEALGILLSRAVPDAPDPASFQRYFEDYSRLILPHFPFAVEPERTLLADGARLQRATLSTELNVLVCKIFATFLSKQPPCCNTSQTSECACWASTLLSCAHDILSGFASSRLPSQLAIAVANLLPTLRVFLSHSSDSGRAALLAAFLRFNEACAPASTARQQCVAFIDAVTEPLRTEAELKPWLASLPKLLWQLKASNIRTTDMALSVLLRCARLSVTGGVDFLQDLLVPFFHVTVQKPGKEKLELFGPFLGLPPELQEKTLHALYFFSSLSPAIERALLACMLEARATKAIASAVQELLAFHHHWKAPEMPFTDFAASASALLVLATAALAGKAEPRVSPQSAVVAVEQLCESMRRVGAADDMLSCCGLVLPAAFAVKELPSAAQSAWPLLCFVLACGGTTSPLCEKLAPLCVSCIVAAVQPPSAAAAFVSHKDMVAVTEAICVRHQALLPAAIAVIAEKLRTCDAASKSKWCSALACIVEMPLLRTPQLLLADEIRTTILALTKEQQSDELRQAVSLLYATA